ncbi:MAG TPA: hypothetical protein VIY48_01500, partial [Candidatus Paceibacterota bacterium]
MEPNKWRSSQSQQGNFVVKIQDYDELIEVWPFILEGYPQLVAADGANMTDLTKEELFKTCLELAVRPEKGFLGVLVNKKGLPLGYIAAHDTTIAYRPRELTVF